MLKNVWYMTCVIALLTAGCSASAGCSSPPTTQDSAPTSEAAEEETPGQESTAGEATGRDSGFVEQTGFDGLGEKLVAELDELTGLMRPLEFIQAGGESYPWPHDRELAIKNLGEAFDADETRRDAVLSFLETPAGQAWSDARRQTATEVDFLVAVGKISAEFDTLPREEAEATMATAGELGQRAMMATRAPLLDATLSIYGLEMMAKYLNEEESAADHFEGEYIEIGDELIADAQKAWRATHNFFDDPQTGEIPPHALQEATQPFVAQFALIPEEHHEEVIAFLEGEDGRWLWDTATNAMKSSMEEAASARVAHFMKLAEVRTQGDHSWLEASKTLQSEMDRIPCRAADFSCFAQSLQDDCQSSVHIAMPMHRGTAFRYEIVEAAEEGCSVDVEILAHNDASLFGQSMTCVLPSGDDADSAFQALKENVEGGSDAPANCEGAPVAALAE